MYTIAVLCGTRRGYRFLEKLIQLAPDIELIVFCFQEEAWEPPFLADIRDFTLTQGGQFFETKQVGGSKWNNFWETTHIDLMFAVSWRFMVPAHVYTRPRLGAFVFHDSLLPEYRGFSPTVWSVINGEDHTGVTLFEIAQEVDEGDIIAQQSVPIGQDDTIAEVMERVTEIYLALLEQNLGNLLKGTAPRFQQNHDRATYTCKRLPEDSLLDWSGSNEKVYNLIRASTIPYSGAYTFLEGQKLRIWAAKRLPSGRRFIGRVPGRVVEICPGQGSVVLTGDGALLITKVQREDGEIVCAAEILNRISHTLGR